MIEEEAGVNLSGIIERTGGTGSQNPGFIAEERAAIGGRSRIVRTTKLGGGREIGKMADLGGNRSLMRVEKNDAAGRGNLKRQLIEEGELGFREGRRVVNRI